MENDLMKNEEKNHFNDCQTIIFNFALGHFSLSF